MKYEELVHEEPCEGFAIKLYLCDEYDPPDWDFETEEERDKLLQDITDGNILWFCAKVTASKNDIELATDYLGGCCYDNVNQFLADGYYDDMRETVINEARTAIKSLCEDN